MFDRVLNLPLITSKNLQPLVVFAKLLSTCLLNLIKDTINPLQLFIFTNVIRCSRLPFEQVILAIRFIRRLAPSPIIWPAALMFYRFSQYFFKIKAGVLIYFPIASQNTEALKQARCQLCQSILSIPIFLTFMLLSSCR